MSDRAPIPRPRPAPRAPLLLALAAALGACFVDHGLVPATDGATSTSSTTAATDPTTGPTPVCGDGLLEPPEVCDDGKLNSEYGACKPDCTPAVCGDGLLAPLERCDDGNTDPNDACLDDCTLPRCGDGVVQPELGEECDDGNADDLGDDCASTCLPLGCGDRIVQPERGEECDHGDLNADDAACTSACKLATCGDGLLGPGEACDPGISDPPCSEICALPSCIDNADPDPGEECEKGTEGCTNRCLLNVCGDGYKLIGTEACDDGNRVDGDGCSADCRNEICGDGVKLPAEECDDGNTDDGDGCSSTCRRDAYFIFVTEEKYTGTFGTLGTADTKCQNSAAAKGLPGTYRAWITFPGDPPATRLKKSDLPYILPGTHTVVAENWAQLVSGNLSHPIDRTADGSEVPPGLSCSSPDVLAWTHTRAGGGPAAGNPCNAWISSTASAVAGLVHAKDLSWSEGCADVSCANALRLYCIEQ